jgi:hypothetical protein
MGRAARDHWAGHFTRDRMKADYVAVFAGVLR